MHRLVDVNLGIIDRARDVPHTGALVSDGAGAASWSQLCDGALRLAAAIHEAELDPRRRVLLIAQNRPSTVLTHVATMLAEAAAVPVNFHLTATEIEYVAEESGARLAFVDSTTEAVARQATSGLDIKIVVLPDVGIAGHDLDEFVGQRAPLELRPDQRVHPSLLFTSGTTGRPKAVQLPPKTVGDAGDLAGFAEHVATHRLAQLGPHLVVGPMYHNGPLTAVRLVLAGVALVVHGRFDAEATLSAIQEHRVESSIMVPTHFVRLLALPDDVRARYDVSSLRQVAHTGGTCPVDVKKAMIDWWGPVLSESYGGTESGTVCSISATEWLAHPGSVGRTVPPFEAVIVDDGGNPIPANSEGRLYFRDSTGRGIVYEGDPEKTAAAHLEPGVFTLGEIGRMDDEGFVYITDRFSDMVVSGGVNIYPAEIEQVLVNHPDVVDAACVGLPDREMGERVVALVQPRPGAVPTAEDLSAWCRARLAGYKCPKDFRMVDQVPRNPLGKIDKRSLRDALL